MKKQPRILKTTLKNCSDFQRRVLEYTLKIPKGQVRTYREVAEAVGSPRACRAVGQALKKNPLPVVIPCHRVIRSDGRLGSYAGGKNKKKKLLIKEKAF